MQTSQQKQWILYTHTHSHTHRLLTSHGACTDSNDCCAATLVLLFWTRREESSKPDLFGSLLLPAICSPRITGTATTCAGGREICLPSMHVACFIGAADWQMLMVCMCAHTEHIFHQAKALASATICVLWVCRCVYVCVWVLWFIGESLCTVAESATVLQRQRLIFIKICCSVLATGHRRGMTGNRNKSLQGYSFMVWTLPW